MKVKVYFATNRNVLDEKQGQLGNVYNTDAPYGLRYGEAEVTAPAKKTDWTSDRFRRASVTLYPEKLLTAEEAEKKGAQPRLGSSALLETLRVQLREGGSDVIMLIHGFASSFDTAIERAAQIKLLYATAKKPVEVVVFSWPSDGRAFGLKAPVGLKLKYFDDRMDAEGSAIAIARAFHRLVEFVRGVSQAEQCGRGMHLVAHSMGNYALRHALQRIQADAPRGVMPRLFDHIFLMAADEDDDALNETHKLERLHELAGDVHVYYARNDGALVISDTTKGNPDRLGAGGPRTLSDLPRKVTLVDCTDVSNTAGLDTHANHQYYRTRGEVVEDVRAVLAGKQPDEIGNRDYVAPNRAFRLRRFRRGAWTP